MFVILSKEKQLVWKQKMEVIRFACKNHFVQSVQIVQRMNRWIQGTEKRIKYLKLFSGGSGGKKVLTLKKETLESNTNLPPFPPLLPLVFKIVCSNCSRLYINEQNEQDE